MNKKRRKEIERLVLELTTIKDDVEKIKDRLDGVKLDTETVRDEEQMAFENMPENLQGSEKGQAIEDYISSLDECVDELDEDLDIDFIDGVIEKLNNIAQE